MFGCSLFGVFSEIPHMQEIVNFDDRMFTHTSPIRSIEPSIRLSEAEIHKEEK